MVNTNLVSFDMTINGLRYINYDRDTPVDCKEIEYVEQTAVESCGFERKYEVQEKACLFIMNKRKQKEAEKEDAERKKRNKFTYWN